VLGPFPVAANSTGPLQRGSAIQEKQASGNANMSPWLSCAIARGQELLPIFPAV
jgi:hypothetical protein